MVTFVELFKCLGEETRLRLATLLAIQGETCVCELAEALETHDAKISRHLAVMKAAQLVTARRQGTWMHYRLREEDASISALQEMLRNLIAPTEQAQADQARLQKAGCGPEQ